MRRHADDAWVGLIAVGLRRPSETALLARTYTVKGGQKEVPKYRRAYVPGGTWFFTVSLLPRHGNDLLVREIDLLRSVTANVGHRHPFKIDAWVVLPEHMHCVLRIPTKSATESEANRPGIPS